MAVERKEKWSTKFYTSNVVTDEGSSIQVQQYNDARFSLPDMSWRHTCMCAASFQYYSESGGELKQNIGLTMKRHAYSYINTKFRTHLKRVHSGHCSGNLCQKLPRDEFPAEIWQITGTGFNWVRAHSQNFVLVLGMRISFKIF